VVTDATESVTTELFGLDGFEVLAAADAGGELELMIETTADLVPCPGCGAVATAKDRRPSWVADLPIAGRPVVLCWVKRVWTCKHPLCEVKTWTEQHEAIAPRALLTARAAAAGVTAVRSGSTVTGSARGFGVSWHTIMRQVRALGRPQVQDPDRLGGVTAIGVDEHAWQRGRAGRPTQYATGIVDLTPGRPARLLDLIEGRSGTALRTWLATRPDAWKRQITTAALDPLARVRHRAGRPATRSDSGPRPVPCMQARPDRPRRRPSPRPTRHPEPPRPQARSALPRRRLLRRRADRLGDRAWQRLEARLTDGDPNGEVTAAWSIAQDLMAAYAAQDTATGRARAEQVIDHALSCPVPEVARLGRTLRAWRPELLAYFTTDRATSNGPTEAINLLIETSRRAGHGFRNFNNYRLRLLLAHGATTCDHGAPTDQKAPSQVRGVEPVIP